AYFLLLLATGLKAFVYLNDYRFMGNFHYMHYWALVAFLFILDKIRTLQFLIVFFYVAASLLKFNLEWLSGAAMLRETFLQGKWLEWACYYVVLLESFFVWGLLSRKPRLFGLTFGQIVLFHLYSFLVVGFYYPSIMACLLSILVLSRHYKELPSSFRGLSHVSII